MLIRLPFTEIAEFAQGVVCRKESFRVDVPAIRGSRLAPLKGSTGTPDNRLSPLLFIILTPTSPWISRQVHGVEPGPAIPNCYSLASVCGSRRSYCHSRRECAVCTGSAGTTSALATLCCHSLIHSFICSLSSTPPLAVPRSTGSQLFRSSS